MNSISASLLIAASLVATTTACGADTCDEWNARMRGLQPSLRNEMLTYGGAYDGEWVIISSSLVRDCDLRVRFSRYSGDVIRGVPPKPEDATAVRQNAELVVSAMVELWPTDGRRFPGEDGAFRDQISSILTRPELDSAAIRPLLSKIIEDDGVTGEVAYVLMERPDPALRSTLLEYATTSGTEPVSNENIFAMAIVLRLGHDILPEVEKVLRRADLTSTQRTALLTLARKARADEPPSWDDVSDLER